MSLIMQGKDFGRIIKSSGANNFLGEGEGPGHGWNYQNRVRRIFKPFGDLYNSSRVTDTSKTFTLETRDGVSPGQGHMPLDENYQPREIKPRCIKFYPLSALSGNCVGLTGSGMRTEAGRALLAELKKKERPHIISVAALGNTKEERISQAEKIGDILKDIEADFEAPVALEPNFTCPNTGDDLKDLENDMFDILDVYRSRVRMPIIPKVNFMYRVNSIMKAKERGLLDAIATSNTLRWLQYYDPYIWKMIFETTVSPLASLDSLGGGWCGWLLIKPNCRFIEELVGAGFDLPISAGGGIGCRRLWDWKMVEEDIRQYVKAGAWALEISTVLWYRPHWIRRIIEFGIKTLKEAGR